MNRLELYCLAAPLAFASLALVPGYAAADTGIFASPPPSSASNEVAAQLQRAAREDSGRGLQFAWLKADVGYHFTSLDGLSGDALLPGDTTTGGLMLGGGAGMRFLFLTAGARFRYLVGDAFDIWNVSGEVAFRVPMGQLEPFVLLGVGYSSVRDVIALTEAQSDALSLGGVNARIAGGIDYFVTPLFSVGARADAEFLFLGRDAIDGASGELSVEQSAIGIGGALSLSLGLHF